MRVLWLTSWYPGKVSMLAGDFIERHAQASSLLHHTYVIHVAKDTTGQFKKVTHEERIYSDQLTAVIYYYPPYGKPGGFADTIASAVYFIRLHRKALQEYRNKYGRPSGILVQVGIKAGIISLLVKKMKGIPYVLFERWTGFLETADPNFRQQPWLLKKLWRSVLRNAKQLVTASTFFGEYFKKNYQAATYQVVPNFINSDLFFPVSKPASKPFQFIHISTLDYQKNFELLLTAFQQVARQDADTILVVYGPILPEVQQLTTKLNLNDSVQYKGEVLHAEIAKALQQADALVLHSRYETFGNVIMEANACGLPVIVSELPVFHELVEEGVNGIFVPGNDAGLLAEKMIWMKNNIQQFDGAKIAAATRQRFSKEKVAQLFDALYRQHFTESRLP